MHRSQPNPEKGAIDPDEPEKVTKGQKRLAILAAFLCNMLTLGRWTPLSLSLPHTLTQGRTIPILRCLPSALWKQSCRQRRHRP